MLKTALFLVIASIFVLGESRYTENEQSVKLMFHSWRQTYEKVYKTTWETQERMRAFSDNIRDINKLNDIYRGQTEFALNQFADMRPEEFKARILMSKRTPPHFEASRYVPHTKGIHALPESFDWTDKGVVTSVKDQGDVGTCWAFSTIGNIEGQWAKMGQKLTNLSVEQVVECDGMHDQPGAKTTNADCGVFGGWPYLAYQYVKKAGGLETEEDYFYCAGLGGKPGTCEVCPAAGYNWTMCGAPVPYCNLTQSCYAKINPKKFVTGLKVLDYVAVSENETLIAEQLMRIGPLSVALDAELLQFYHKGVFNPIFCSKTSLDHAVLLVGFGTEKDLFSTKPYWKVKNSWGPAWGEKGYFRMNRGGGTCGVNTQVTSVVLQKA